MRSLEVGMPSLSQAHYRGSYARRAKAVRDAANANPATRCRRCGRTLEQHPPHRNGTPATWDAGHIHDGQIDGPLAPEASTCNRTAGATLGNQRRQARKMRTTRDW